MAAQFTRSRENLLASLARLNEAQIQELLPGRDWSIQDTLAHLASNQELMVELLGDIVAGRRGTLPDDFDNQRFNDEQVAQGRTERIAQVRAELDASYTRLFALLETVSPEALTRRGTHPAAGDADVKEFLLAMYAHHEMHCRDVLEQTRRLTKKA